MKRILAIFTGVLLLSGCFVIRRDIVVPINPMMDRDSQRSSRVEYESNGEQIYFTAMNDRGQRIRYSAGSNYGGIMMGMGTRLACVSCHGLDGRGGIHTMHMDVMDAPDIRIAALNSDIDDHGDDGHGDEHSEYDLDSFRLAVIGGVHPDGETLSREMPRWRMDNKDLEDLFEFLETLR